MPAWLSPLFGDFLYLHLAWALALVYTDLRYRRLPNLLTFGAMAAGAMALLAHGQTPLGADPKSALSGAALALALTLPGYLTGRLGAGDVKLLAAIALLGGLQAVLVSFAVGALGVGAVALGLALLRRFYGYSPPAGRFLPMGAGFAAGYACVLLLPNLWRLS